MTTNKLIIPKALTRENFAPFGDVIEVNDKAKNFSINEGFTQRYHDLADVDVTQENGRTLINIFRSTPLEQPVSIKMMERHPLGSQAFMPLTATPFLVVVAKAGPEPKLADIRAFVSNGKQGVNYSTGVWHHPLLILAPEQNFLVVDRAGEGNNLNEVMFNEDQCGQLDVTDLINDLNRLS